MPQGPPGLCLSPENAGWETRTGTGHDKRWCSSAPLSWPSGEADRTHKRLQRTHARLLEMVSDTTR